MWSVVGNLRASAGTEALGTYRSTHCQFIDATLKRESNEKGAQLPFRLFKPDRLNCLPTDLIVSYHQSITSWFHGPVWP